MADHSYIQNIQPLDKEVKAALETVVSNLGAGGTAQADLDATEATIITDLGVLRTPIVATVVDLGVLRTSIIAIATAVDAIATKINTLTTKLNADAGVTDTDYATNFATNLAAGAGTPAAITAATPAAITTA